MNRMRFSVWALGLLLLPNIALATDVGHPEITVTGTAEVKVVPDEFVLTTSVESRSKKTTSESESSEAPLTPIGYVVKRQLSIRSPKLDQFESLYRGLIECGINEIDGISFQTSKLREHRDLARIHAIRAAKEKATALAGELGAKLIGVQTIHETGAGYPNYGIQNSSADPFGDADGNSTTIAAGQIHISARVEVVFRLGSTEFE